MPTSKNSEVTYSGICAQVNAALETSQLIEYIGWNPEKLVRYGDVFNALCPVHKDTLFRTLVLNPRNNTCQCSHVHCPANHPSDYLELVARAKNQTLPEAIHGIVERFGPGAFRLSAKQVGLIKELVRQLEEERAQQGQQQQ